ncbi:HAMP domain-containing sensor histidine kinase [Microbispora sp. NPDC046973]|uniref:sensor histidine kinase n=1 Tax=Microbispora sp. NPDC046973 TaxID=3155022 RepID=UPI00340CB5BD
MGVRLRTTLTATAAVAAALCLASIALFTALDSSLTASTKELAANDAKEQMRHLKAESGPGYAGDGTGMVSPLEKGAVPPGGKGPMPGSAATGEDDGPPIPDEAVFVVRRTFETEDGPVTVLGKASKAPALAAMTTLRNLLIPGVPALLAVVALFTWLAVGRVLRPVSAIRAKVADITAHGLHERVPEPDTRDEIAALARTVNATLDRLQTSVDAQRQFVADAAHELRSPLAILRTRLELARPAEKPLATAALDDVARLQSLSADLLLLARLDAGEPLSRAEELDLAQVVAEEAVRKRPRPDVHVYLDLTPDLLLDGSADQLRRLVANLVDNAVRHASTSVHVTLTALGDHAVLDVVDDGPGIPPEHHAIVFDRFTRLDHARTRDTGGSGLGLPIARDIARAHGGTLQVVPHSPGARLRAVFPLSGRSAADPLGDLAVCAHRRERA